MVDVSIVNETSREANWNGHPGGQEHVLSQADTLTTLILKFLLIRSVIFGSSRSSIIFDVLLFLRLS